VPRYPDLFDERDTDAPWSRFTTGLAVAISFGEYGDGESGAEASAVLRESVGEWLLEEQPELGRAEAFDGSAGRGAAAWVPVVQWAGELLANNAVNIAIATALSDVIRRLRERRRSREREGTFLGIEVSRGVAAALAAADVGEHFEERGPLEVEAVEEPSSVAGHEVTELSYTGLEPWIVLIRNMEAEVRYIVVVLPDGVIAGRLTVPFLPFEAGYLPPSRFIPEPAAPAAGIGTEPASPGAALRAE
jgi:hypothetical protein